MKRDMDLVRTILKSIEDRSPDSNRMDIEIEGHSLNEVREHLKIMEDAGLVEGVKGSRDSVSVVRMSWQGHDFLDAARDDTKWDKAKSLTISAAGGLVFEVLKECLKTLAMQSLQGQL